MISYILQGRIKRNLNLKRLFGEPVKTVLFFTLIFLECFFCNGCSKNSDNEDNANISGNGIQKVMKCPMVSDPSSLDPAYIDEPFTRQALVNQVYENLVTYDINNNLVPGLAKSWKVLPNRLAYIFKLKKGVMFHNNKELTANDVKWSLERACAAKLASPTAETYLKYIHGADKMLKGESPHLSGVEIIDKYTLMITITKKLNYFLALLTHPVAAIMSKDSAPKNSRITKIYEMAGTGPYKVADYISNQYMLLESFEKFHQGKTKLDKVFIKISGDRTTNINKFKASEFDFTYVPFTEVPNVRGDTAISKNLTMASNSSTTYFVLMKHAYKPFEDPNIRKAISLAINRKYIVDELLKGSGVHYATNLIPPAAIPGYRKYAEKLRTYEYNPDEAKKLLANSEYAETIGQYPLEILVTEGSPTSALIAENVIIQLRNCLGIHAKRKSMEYSAFVQQGNQEKSAMTLTTKYADYLDPSTYLRDLFHSEIGVHKRAYQNEAFNKLVDTAIILEDIHEAYQKYYNAEQMLLNDAVVIPVIFPASAILKQSHLKDLKTNAMGLIPFVETNIVK